MTLLNISSGAVLLILGAIFLAMAGPPLIMTIIAFSIRKRKPYNAKVLFILSAVYLVIAGGTCGGLMEGF